MALSTGEVKFKGMVRPNTKLLEYGIDFKRVMRGRLVLGTADGWLTLMEIYPAHAHIEIGNIWFSPRMQRSRAATEAMSLLRAAVSDLVEAEEGVLSITTVQSVGGQWLAPRLGGFQIAHPRIAVGDELVPRFIARFESRSGTVARVADLAQVPEAVAAYQARLGLPPRAAVARPLAGLAWPAGFSHHPGPAGQSEILSVTPCLAGIAEVGSVALPSGPDSPTTLNFVPDHHLVVLHCSQIVRHFEDVWPLVRARPGGMPRTINLVAGPSRTGDVELTLQLGAHGPRSVHVILVDAPI